LSIYSACEIGNTNQLYFSRCYNKEFFYLCCFESWSPCSVIG